MSLSSKLNEITKGITKLYLREVETNKIYFKKMPEDFKFNNDKNCCLAPHSTINFDTMGYMRVCCYNNDFLLGKYPETNLHDAWFNPKRIKFIESLKKLNFPKGCHLCKKQVIQGNTKNALFTHFDSYEPEINDYPISFTFDLGTICNYECIMCGGKWSSSIRKNREKLPALKSPYDDNFVKELKEFIPHLKHANFLGGEPFLNNIYYKIWNYILIRNRHLNINITTNGSIYNPKIENYLNNFPNARIVVSLDSLEEDTYQFIRRRGNFKSVMENIKRFKDLGKMGGIAFCPMIQNIHELPNIIQYCIDNGYDLSINDVTEPLGGRLEGIHENAKGNVYIWTGPNEPIEKIDPTKLDNKTLLPEVALKTLPKEKLQNIITDLKKYNFNDYMTYQGKYMSFINSLEHQLETAKA